MSFLSSFGQSKQSPDWSFGNLPTTSAAPAQQSTGAFGIGISGAATNTTTGNNTTAQGQQQQAFPTPGGLFSNVGNAARSTAQPAPFSLNATAGQQANPFASASQPSQQQQQPALFNTNPLSNSFFTQQSNAGGLLGGNAMNQPVSQLPNATEVAGGFDPSRGPLQASQGPVTSQPAYFSHLLERGKKRSNQNEQSDDVNGLPPLQLALGDIARKVRDLGNGPGPSTAGADRDRDTKAHYLLAASGASATSALRNLKVLNAEAGPRAAAVTAEQPDVDLQGYLANVRAKSTLDMIDGALEQSKRDFDNFIAERVQINWEEQRQRTFEHFGLLRRNFDGKADGSVTNDRAKGSFGRSTRGRALGSSQNADAQKWFGSTSGMRSVIGSDLRGSHNGTIFSDRADNPGLDGSGLQSDSRHFREKQDYLASKTREFNRARLEEVTFPVFSHYCAVEAELATDESAQIINAYNALMEVTEEANTASGLTTPGSKKKRRFLDAYLDESPDSAKSVALRKRIIDGARTSLEKQFFHQLEAMIAKNPKEASLGGMPTPINKVRAYIRLLSARRELSADNAILQTLEADYCWALIFFLLRCGLFDEAIQYVTENEKALKNMDRNFSTYLSCYVRDPNRRLTPELQNRINTEYLSRTRNAPENTIDPYRIACFKVIGRCDLSRRSLDHVKQKMEDWVWLQFSLAREVKKAEEVRGDVFGLEDLRSVIVEIGQRHFPKDGRLGSGYATFFYLQILAGLYEQAVAYLYTHNYMTAVHFAIALVSYGLLRVSGANVPALEPLSYTTTRKPQICFGHMVGYYTRDFRTAKADLAAEYLVLICLNADLEGEAGKSQASLCYEALREIVLETREYALLLGDIRSDGQRINGIIELRLKLISLTDQDEFLRVITLQAAAVADDSGRITDAVLLYHLAEDYDSAITIINRALSDALSVDIDAAPMRLAPLKPRTETASRAAADQAQSDTSLSLTSVDDPIILARDMTALYNSNALYYRKIKQANREACGLLLRMHEVRSKVASGQWAVIELVQSLNILPLTAQGNISIIRAAAQNFSTLPQVLASNVGNLLMWTIVSCGKERRNLQASAYEDRTRKDMADGYLTVAKDLMVFAGLIKYKLAPKVFDALARAGQDVGAY